MGEFTETESVFGKFNSFIQGQFFGSLFSLRPITLLCPTPAPVNLSQDPSLGCARTP